jgi:hypothetical protein
MFCAKDAGQVQLSNKFSILATDALQVGQQSPVLLKLKDGTRIIHYEDTESRHWEVAMVEKLIPSFNKTWVLNLIYVVISNQILLLQRLLRI